MEITNEERREIATRLRRNAQLYPNALFDLHEAVGDSTYTLGGIAYRLADLIDRPMREDFRDNENSNVVDNLSLLINPVGACRLTAEQQLEALEEAIGCSDGQDWQDQTWVERLMELIDSCPECGAEVVE